MPSMTVKNIPDALYEQLKDNASKHRRSINSEILVCLEQSLGTRRVDPDATLARIAVLHKTLDSRLFLTEEILHKAKNAGRP